MPGDAREDAVGDARDDALAVDASAVDVLTFAVLADGLWAVVVDVVATDCCDEIHQHPSQQLTQSYISS